LEAFSSKLIYLDMTRHLFLFLLLLGLQFFAVGQGKKATTAMAATPGAPGKNRGEGAYDQVAA
jgi:hypothetical protein